MLLFWFFLLFQALFEEEPGFQQSLGLRLGLGHAWERCTDARSIRMQRAGPVSPREGYLCSWVSS